MQFGESNNKVIKIEEFPVQLRFSRPDEKLGIVNMATETNPHFGRVHMTSTIETEEIPNRIEQEKRKENKREIQVMKIKMECSAKKNKSFGITLPLNRGPKRTNDAKIHLLLELTNERRMLTVADDYADARMIIKGSEAEHHQEEQIQRQKRMNDMRRKSNFDDQPYDPEFHEKDEDDSENPRF